MNETDKRKAFQRVKAMSNDMFWDWMNLMHSRAYDKAVQHYTEAADIVLTTKQRESLHAKAVDIRETWDGIREVTLSDTEAEQIIGRRTS
jgi:hypothetical protein